MSDWQLSIPYMVTRSRKLADGVRELIELDLFEISIVPAPANEDTRLLSLKAADDAPPLDARSASE